MGTLVVLGLLGLSTLVLSGVVRGLRRGRAAPSLPNAMSDAVSFAGTWTICLVLNLALGVAIVLALRTATARFVSIYLLNDVALVVCSAIQAAVVHALLRPCPAGGARSSES
jgi:hypothetical protein